MKNSLFSTGGVTGLLHGRRSQFLVLRTLFYLRIYYLGFGVLSREGSRGSNHRRPKSIQYGDRETQKFPVSQTPNLSALCSALNSTGSKLSITSNKRRSSIHSRHAPNPPVPVQPPFPRPKLTRNPAPYFGLSSLTSTQIFPPVFQGATNSRRFKTCTPVVYRIATPFRTQGAFYLRMQNRPPRRRLLRRHPQSACASLPRDEIS